jgi:copper(I)-binding protein
VRFPAPLRATLLVLVGFALAVHAPSVPSAAAQPGMLSAEDAWIRILPGADVAAAYMTLRNRGSAAVTVVGAHSSLASAALLHESRMVDGQSQMRPLERLEIPAGGVVQLKPGGLHLMLHGLTGAPLPGEQVQILLELEGGGALPVSARVRALGAD